MKKYTIVACAMMALFIACMPLQGFSIELDIDNAEAAAYRVLEVDIDTVQAELIKTYVLSVLMVKNILLSKKSPIVLEKL
jgi:hypothetical protein